MRSDRIAITYDCMKLFDVQIPERAKGLFSRPNRINLLYRLLEDEKQNKSMRTQGGALVQTWGLLN